MRWTYHFDTYIQANATWIYSRNLWEKFNIYDKIFLIIKYPLNSAREIEFLNLISRSREQYQLVKWTSFNIIRLSQAQNYYLIY